MPLGDLGDLGGKGKSGNCDRKNMDFQGKMGIPEEKNETSSRKQCGFWRENQDYGAEARGLLEGKWEFWGGKWEFQQENSNWKTGTAEGK